MTHEDDDSAKADDVTDLLGPALARVAREWRPMLLVAVAQMAGERYREWAATPAGERYRSRLLTCANRQEDIARTVDALYADAAVIERETLARVPDLADIDRGTFAGRPLAEQFLIQARWARLSAAVWRAFAQKEPAAARNCAFRGCAELEEMNALVLEATVSAPSTQAGARAEDHALTSAATETLASATAWMPSRSRGREAVDPKVPPATIRRRGRAS